MQNINALLCVFACVAVLSNCASAPKLSTGRIAELTEISEMQSLLISLEIDFAAITSILQRTRVLAIQSANGIYTDDDRRQIAAEHEELFKELLRIREDSRFKEIPLLNSGETGWRTGFALTLSAHSQPILFQLPDLKAETFGLVSWKTANLQREANLLTPGSSNSTIGIMDEALSQISYERARVGALYNRLEIARDREEAQLQNRQSRNSRNTPG